MSGPTLSELVARARDEGAAEGAEPWARHDARMAEVAKKAAAAASEMAAARVHLEFVKLLGVQYRAPGMVEVVIGMETHAAATEAHSKQWAGELGRLALMARHELDDARAAQLADAVRATCPP